MASIPPGFEYDIFISYRQNDNRSGWVTEFVKALQEELASTIKEPVSVYFDSNPNDGLLETHNVDKSLEGKLKCLIFIPILSQTYCDPKSFAWQNEFCAFNKLAKADQIGRDIKLGNGNVTSRILPIKIHELDIDDKAVLQSETGSVLRAIEFIFRSPGVNRPLRANEDRPSDNQNKTFYRDQVNKVANAVKEIISGLKNFPGKPKKFEKQEQKNSRGKEAPVSSFGRRKVAVGAGIAFAMVLLLVVVVGKFADFKFLKESENLSSHLPDNSIAVLPFVDISSGHDQEYFSDGLSEELINLLVKINNMKVIGRTSSFSFKGKNEDLRVIGEKLGVANLLEGSVRKAGHKIRITAQLIKVSDGSNLWSDTYDRDMDDIFKIQDEIAKAVVTQLKFKLMREPSSETHNTEAYNLFLQGKYFYLLSTKESILKSLELLQQALSIDSANAKIWAALSFSYASSDGDIDSKEAFKNARTAAEKSIQLDNQCAECHNALGNSMKSIWDWVGAESELRKAMQLEPGNLETRRAMASLANDLGRQDEAVELCRKITELDPISVAGYYSLGFTYWCHHQPKEAMAMFKKVEAMSPQRLWIHVSIGTIHLELNHPDSAVAEMQKETYEAIRVFGLALAYHSAGRHTESDKALHELIEKYSKSMAYQIAEAYAYRGEADKTFEWLETAYSQHDGGLTWIKVNPLLAPNIRSDKRFNALLRKMNLPL